MVAIYQGGELHLLGWWLTTAVGMHAGIITFFANADLEGGFNGVQYYRNT